MKPKNKKPIKHDTKKENFFLIFSIYLCLTLFIITVIKNIDISNDKFPEKLSYHPNLLVPLKVLGEDIKCPKEPEYICEFHQPLPIFVFISALFLKLTKNIYSYLVANFIFGLSNLLIFYKITNDLKLTMMLLLIPEFIWSVLTPHQEQYFILFLLLCLFFTYKQKYEFSMILASISILARAIFIAPIAYLFYLILNKKFKPHFIIYPTITFLLFIFYFFYFFNDPFYYFKSQEYLIFEINNSPHIPLIGLKMKIDTRVLVYSFTYIGVSAIGLYFLYNKYKMSLLFILPLFLMSFYFYFLVNDGMLINMPRFLFTISPFITIAFKEKIDKFFNFLVPPVLIVWYTRLLFALKL